MSKLFNNSGGIRLFEKNGEEIMTGHYDPQMVKEKKVDGKIMPFYPDSTYSEKENTIEVERRMMVGKQPIIVRSFFMTDAGKTPTQKLLGVINSIVEKTAI